MLALAGDLFFGAPTGAYDFLRVSNTPTWRQNYGIRGWGGDGLGINCWGWWWWRRCWCYRCTRGCRNGGRQNGTSFSYPNRSFVLLCSFQLSALLAADLAAIVLADGSATAIFTLRPLAAVLADGRSLAVYAVALAAAMLAQRPATAIFTQPPLEIVLALSAFFL